MTGTAVYAKQAVVAKVYKSLLPHQAQVGFTMAPAKACLNQKPVAAWDLEESLRTAVIKTLTGCSSGTASSTSTDTTHAGTASGGNQAWMCLSRRKVVAANMLTAPPGEVSTAAFVEQEVKYDAGHKGLLLIVHAAGGWHHCGQPDRQTVSVQWAQAVRLQQDGSHSNSTTPLQPGGCCQTCLHGSELMLSVLWLP